MNRDEALVEIDEALSLLDSLADEDGVVDSFIKEALLIDLGDETFAVNYGQMFYELGLMGEHQLVIDFEKAKGWI